MKRLIILTISILLSIPAIAQDFEIVNSNEGDTIKKLTWFQRLFSKRTEVVHDTVYIFVNNYLDSNNEDAEEDDDELMEKEEHSGSIPLPFDTIDTDDKFQKVLLFDNGTWAYWDVPKPDVPDFISNDHWMTESVHAYTDINIKDLPEKVTLVLCDSTHSWHIPGNGTVVSPYKLRTNTKALTWEWSTETPFMRPLMALFARHYLPVTREVMATWSCCVMPMAWRPITDT